MVSSSFTSSRFLGIGAVILTCFVVFDFFLSFFKAPWIRHCVLFHKPRALNLWLNQFSIFFANGKKIRLVLRSHPVQALDLNLIVQIFRLKTVCCMPWLPYCTIVFSDGTTFNLQQTNKLLIGVAFNYELLLLKFLAAAQKKRSKEREEKKWATDFFSPSQCTNEPFISMPLWQTLTGRGEQCNT